MFCSIVYAVLFVSISIGNEVQSDSAAIWNANGTSSYNQGKYSEALQAFNKAIELDSQRPQIWYNKGNALYSQGIYDEAIQAYDKVIELDPQFTYAWFAKAKALNNQHKYDETIQAIDKELELNPQDSEAWDIKGSALNALGLIVEANQAFDKAIECDPNNAKAWYNKGLVLKSLGKDGEAETAFSKAKELGYTSSPAGASATKGADQSQGQLTKTKINTKAKQLSGYNKPRDYAPPLNPNAFKSDAAKSRLESDMMKAGQGAGLSNDSVKKYSDAYKYALANGVTNDEDARKYAKEVAGWTDRERDKFDAYGKPQGETRSKSEVEKYGGLQKRKFGGMTAYGLKKFVANSYSK